MINIDLSFIKAFSPNEQLVMLQLLLHADKDGVVEFSDRGVSKVTEIPYQQVRTIHQRWLADGTLSNAASNAGTNAKECFVTICDYDSYNVINFFSNAVSNAVTNALKDKEIQTGKDKVSPVTPIPTEKEKNKEKEGKEDALASKKSGFVKPMIEDISAYVISKGYHFDAESFMAYYESNGWMIGKSKMKDWKAACVTWEKKWKESHPSFQQMDMFNAPAPNPQPTQQQQVYTAYGMTFGSQQEADAFSEVQVKIRSDYFCGKIKAASNQVDEHLRMGDAVKVIDGVIYDYD